MLAWRLRSKAGAKETAQILREKDDSDDEQQIANEKASGNALQDIKNRLSARRKKTPTMELEEK